ncbi:MAG: helix-turn-helix transcriptional regulator [Spirochaetia bacterium]|nr:helix-turn-helix transcriptional regulator [Spirochaetia bacterium]
MASKASLFFVSRGRFGARDAPRHSHATCEVVVYIKGRGTLTIGDATLPFQEGTVCFFPPGVSHRESSSVGYESYWVQFPATKNTPTETKVIQDAGHAPIRKILDLLFHEFQLDPDHTGSVFDHLLQALIGTLLPSVSDVPLQAEMHRLRDLMINHIGDPEFNLENALAKLPFSRALAYRKFRKAFHQTPSRFLSERRMMHARNLLEIPDLSIRDIASQAGYPDPLYFSKAFRKQFGDSPRGYRQRKQLIFKKANAQK